MANAHQRQATDSPDAMRQTATPESVAAAREAQERERAQFTRQTGMRLNHDGQLRRSALHMIDSSRERRH
jgi:hypothetical protein